MLPQLLFTSHLPIQNNTLNYQWLGELVNFVEGPNPGATTTPPSGQRGNIVPGISLPLSNLAGYITPTVQYELTQYNVGDQPYGYPDQITRAIPISDIDSGLFFQRDTSLFGKNYEQTLEPRVFYLYVPYHNQSDIPVFDSALVPFTYNQLFLTNRFSGSDRIGDANQVSFALSTRTIDQDTGDQKFSAGVGIIKYFEVRRVTLCSTPGCVDSLFSVGSTSTTDPVSPVVGQATYNFNPNWSTSASAAWNPDNKQTQNAAVNFQYMPAPNHIFNLGYNYLRYGDIYTLPSNPSASQLSNNGTSANSKFNLSEPTASFAWPFNDTWSGVGSWSYSWNQGHGLTYFAGVQYNTCCWGVQVVLARTYSGLNPVSGVPEFNNGVFVQWAFKGLAKFAGNDPTSLLLNGIPGYQNNFNAV
jgi:LPS-assembly protein